MLRLTASLFGTVSLASLVSCSPMNSQMLTTSALKTGAPLPGVATSLDADMSCLDDKVDLVINTNILDFEMFVGAAIKAGYTPTGPVANIGIDVSYDMGQLDTVMTVSDPLKPNAAPLSISAMAQKTNLKFDVGFTTGLITLNPSFYYSTPVAQLSMDALQKNLAAVVAALHDSPWWTPIMKMDSQKGFSISAGTSAGLRPGDVLQVMDVTYKWGGDETPCKNELQVPFWNSTTPIATATVTNNISSDYAYLEINSSTRALSRHMYVTVGKLVDAPAQACTNPFGLGCPSQAATRSLSRAVRVGAVTGHPMVFEGANGASTTVDMSTFAGVQLSTLLNPGNSSGFYLHR